jgi:hypothetical protein
MRATKLLAADEQGLTPMKKTEIICVHQRSSAAHE